jgi:transcriptional regulator with XRE-family HTH domain
MARGPRPRDDTVAELIEAARRSQGYTKKALALKLGIVPRTYRNWMSRASRLQSDEVARLVEALGLSEKNRANLYVLTRQLPPSPELGLLRRTPEMELYQCVVDGSAHPSVVHTACWDVVCVNQPFRDVFGGVRPHINAHPLRNTQRFIFFHPDAPALLGAGDSEAFTEKWLMPALAHFSAVLQQRPNDQRLHGIEDDINRRPPLRRAYRRAPSWIAEHGDIEIDASARPIWDPRARRTVQAHLITEAHQGYQTTPLQRSTFVFREPQARSRTAAFEQGVLFTREYVVGGDA